MLSGQVNILTIFPQLNQCSLEYLLFIAYLAFFCWLVVRIPFLKNAGLSRTVLLILFFLKVMAGLTIGWLSLHYYNAGNDYWDLNREAWKEYQSLCSHPWDFFTDIFRSPYAKGYSGLFDSTNSFWGDLKNNLVIKLVALFNVFSRGNYYTNSLFFNFLVFFGHVILYRLFSKIYPGKKYRVVIGCFLLPSLLYFSSGIHKDGLVFLLLAILLYSVYNSFQKERIGIRRLLLTVISLVFLFLFRNFLFFALIPALIAWVWSEKSTWPAWFSFLMAYFTCGLLLFAIGIVFPAVNPLEVIARRQADYLQLPISATPLHMDTLQPYISSFLYHAPQALNHVLMRPYITELPSVILLPMNIELLIYQLLFLVFIFFHEKRNKQAKANVLLFMLCFTFTVFLFIGYIIPNLGSLIRYRSIYLPFIIAPLLCGIDWKKIYANNKLII